MTKRSILISFVSLAMLITASAMIYSKKNVKATGGDMLPVTLRSFKIADKWGYDILVDNKVYIHQDIIPAVPFHKRFATESDALLIGNMVIDKMKHGRKPVITVQEIKNSNIPY